MEGRDQVRVLLVEDDEDDFILVRDLGQADLTVIADWVETPRGRCAIAAPAGIPVRATPGRGSSEDLLASWDPTRFAAAALN